MRFIMIFFAVLFSLTACKKTDPNTLLIGTISGPETELVEEAKKIAHKNYGLNIKIVEFSDYNLPNQALQDGSLDANVYQHLPYLQAAKKARGYDLEALGKTFVYPTGIYSEKYKNLEKLPKHSIIAIPNDPSNEARALLLLEKAKLIRLKNNSPTATVNDIAENPKKIRFKELDAAQLPRILPDVDAAVINTNFALPAGLKPNQDALFLESKDSPYANIIVIKSNNPKRKQLEQFVDAFQSREVKEKAEKIFGDSAIPAW